MVSETLTAMGLLQTVGRSRHSLRKDLGWGPQATLVEGKDREGSCTCSAVREVNALGTTGQDDNELVAGPSLVDQGLRQVGLQNSQQSLCHRLLQAGPSTKMSGRQLNFAHHLQGI